MPINLQCSCGKSFTVDDPQLGTDTKCPACGRLVSDNAATADKTPKPAKRVGPSVADDDADMPEIRKPIKRPSSANWSIFSPLRGKGCGIAVIVMVFACGGVAALLDSIRTADAEPIQAASAPGSIAGTIRYVGDVPASQRIMTTDGGQILHNDIVVHAPTKGLRDVVVVLDSQEKKPADAKAKPVVIDQRNMLFMPRVVAVQDGQGVRFENNDICNHAVHAHSATAENAFNITTPMGQPYEHKFKAQKHPVLIGCPLHGWMRAWIIVTPHPYHAVTDAEGKFRIDNVPAGKHVLLLTHPDTNHRDSVSVEVQSGKTAEITREWTKLTK